MAVLTEAIEAERGAGAVTVGGRVVTATVMTVEISTVVVDELAVALDRLVMTATTAPPAVRDGTSEMMTGVLAMTVGAAR